MLEPLVGRVLVHGGDRGDGQAIGLGREQEVLSAVPVFPTPVVPRQQWKPVRPGSRAQASNLLPLKPATIPCFIAKELRPWVDTFPDKFYQQVSALRARICALCF